MIKDEKDNFEESIDNLRIDDNIDNNEDLDINCNLILTKLNSIFEKITKYYDFSSEEMANYTSFLKSFSSQLSEINNIYKSTKRKTNMSNFNNYFFDKFNNYNLMIVEKISDLASQIQRSILSPFEIYKEKYISENDNIKSVFKQLIDKIKKENDDLIHIKKVYDDQKKKYEYEKDLEQKKKIKEKYEIQIEYYKLKVNEINLSLMDFKNECNNILEDIKNKQIIRNQSIKKSIKNYFDIMDNFFIKSNEDINNFKKKESDINDSLKEDQFSKNIKLKIEEIKWEISSKKNEKNKKNKSDIINKSEIIPKEENENKNLNINNSEVPKLSTNKTLRNNINIILKDTISDIKNNLNKKSNKKDISKFISNLYSKDDLPQNEAAEFFIHLSEDNLNFQIYSETVNCLYNYKRDQNRTIQEFLNFNNFTHLSNILNLLIENLSNNENQKYQYEKYILLDKILCIGEETVFENTYICSLLSNNKKLKNQNIWNNCITYKLIYYLNIKSDKYFSSNSKGQKLLGYGKNLLNKINIYDNKKKNNNDKDDFIVQKGYNKYINHYKDLSMEIKETLNKKDLPNLMHDILKLYISHMANYNYPLEESYKIIEGIYYEYFNYKEPELINFYINYSIASSFSVRKIIPVGNVKQNIKSEEITKKIQEIKNHKFLVENKNYFSLDAISNKFLILKNALLFLTNSEKIKLINLNKSLYELLKKEIYFHIITSIKNTSFNIKEHIQIWKCFLKCNSIYKRAGLENYTYESIIETIFSDVENNLKDFKLDIRTINLDIPRSPFKHKLEKEEKESSYKALKNILYSFLYINNKIKPKNIIYYQGINYVSTFLYEMTHNEEDCVLILSGLFYSTEYSEIFSQNMEKMQKYLYVMERLVNLYLPKIQYHLKENRLELNFFANPIFISLFTNIYSSLPDNDYSFLLEIWDDFILNGWKTIFTDILAILKQNEKKILDLTAEKLIKYLSDGIKNGEMFTIYNYDEFKKVKNQFKPSNQLLEILSKELSLEQNLQN